MPKDPEKTITIGCGVWGPVLSAVIIASRAYCSKVPMEDWSIWSWILMTLPTTLPAIFAILFLFAWALAWSVSKSKGIY